MNDLDKQIVNCLLGKEITSIRYSYYERRSGRSDPGITICTSGGGEFSVYNSRLCCESAEMLINGYRRSANVPKRVHRIEPHSDIEIVDNEIDYKAIMFRVKINDELVVDLQGQSRGCQLVRDLYFITNIQPCLWRE